MTSCSKHTLRILLICHLASLFSKSPTIAADNQPKDGQSAKVVKYSPGISGMAPIDKNTYLVVHDESKPGRPRAGIYKAGKDEIEYQSIAIDDSHIAGGPLADIESLAAIPGRTSQFFLLESGDTSKGQSPRRVLAQVELSMKPEPTLRVIAWQDTAKQTQPLANTEGMVCWKYGNQFMLMIADRGAAEDGNMRFAYMMSNVSPIEGKASANAAQLGFGKGGAEGSASAVKQIELPLPAGKDWRACSDLLLDGSGMLWGACAEDLGKKGPFQSVIYCIGPVDRTTGTIAMGECELVFRCDGVKVEALAAHHKGNTRMCYGTDDEKLGGVVRTLPDKSLNKDDNK